VVGAVSFPLFYLLHLLRETHEYDNAWLRGIAAVMCLALILRERWPQRLRPYYLGWSYATFIYCLPFFFMFMSLKNGGGTVSVANTFMAVFFLILLTDWRNTLVMLLLGTVLAVAAYVLTTDHPGMPHDYVGRWPSFVLVVIGCSVLKFSQRQIQAERMDAVTALAGSIAHEMRHPLGQVQRSLRAIGDLLPVPLMRTPSHTLPSPALEALYRQVASGEQAVRRGLQVVSMTLDEVSARAPDRASFSLLSAAESTERALREYDFETPELRDRVRVNVVEDFTFRGEETAYFFVLFNLLKNALYYAPTHPGMTVTITIVAGGIGVRDTGPGIPPEILGQLFHPFVTAAKQGGTGLGLAYCRRVMRAFDGDITCESVVGQFTSFALSFPPLDPAEARAHEAALLERVKAVLHGGRVLVVDDDAAQRLTTTYKLQAIGAQIDQAGDGQRALEALAAQPYDMVLLDLNMPVMDGYEFAERVRAGHAPPNGNVAIVAYTSDPPYLASIKTRKAGMDGFVGKPASRAQLLQAMLGGIEHARSSRHPAGVAGKRVLLADDSAHSRKAVAAYLKHAGASVTEVDHGQAALDRLAAGEPFNVVLLDINMPGMDGLQVARAIRALPAGGPLPIVALTAHSDDLTVQAAQAAGMTDFITKPVEADVLYRKLAQVIAGGQQPGGPLKPTFSPVAAGPADMLLNSERLQSYLRIGMLGELMDDYLPEIAGLVGKLQRQSAQQDFRACQDTLHSLLGMSGEAGAQALYQAVRRVYVPMVETQAWPQQGNWVVNIAALAAETEKALKAFAASASMTPDRS
jgi:CheY-like chemotaxis protein/HPt (histidine-containing phosphotransfer) domain-containing protein